MDVLQRHATPHAPLALPEDRRDFEVEDALAPNDFTQDSQLRALRLDQWFATAEYGIPMWWH